VSAREVTGEEVVAWIERLEGMIATRDQTIAIQQATIAALTKRLLDAGLVDPENPPPASMLPPVVQ
jgi:hypothetical protein